MMRPVIIVVPTESWLTQLTPMTRLLLAASYTDGSSADVHFASPREISISFAREGQTRERSSDDVTDDESVNVLPTTSDTSDTPIRVERLRCGWLERAWRVSFAQNALERFAVNGALPVSFSEKTCEPAIGEALAVGTPLAGDARMGQVKAERGNWLPTDEDVVSVRDAFAGLCLEPTAVPVRGRTSLAAPENAAAAAAPRSPAGGVRRRRVRHSALLDLPARHRRVSKTCALATRPERTPGRRRRRPRRQNTETTKLFIC